MSFPDRKSTRLNSSHLVISYAVFCLKKKNKRKREDATSLDATAIGCGRPGAMLVCQRRVAVRLSCPQVMAPVEVFFFFFFFNDTATTEIYTLSLHDALPI